MTDVETLSRTGELYSDQREANIIPDLSYTNSRGEHRPVAIDEAVLRQSGVVYTDTPLLHDYLQEHDITTSSYAAANALVRNVYAGPKSLWGFSGFATGGFNYSPEAEGMAKVYDRLAERNLLPGLVVDGGVSAGVLGLNGLIARNYAVPTMGVIPRAGLSSVGVRDHMLIWGDSYRQREKMVGTLPDVLVCMGGAEGTLRECQRAIACGSAVMLLTVKDYGKQSLPATYAQYEDLAAAEKQGQLVVCEPEDDVAKRVDQVHTAGSYSDRVSRLALVGTLLQQ